MRAVLLMAVLLAVPAASALPWLDAVDDAYQVAVTASPWGPGVGYMRGHPALGVILDLELAFATGRFSFSIGGTQGQVQLPDGSGIVLDQWSRGGAQRFIGGYHVDASGEPTGVAWGEGNLNGFAITVLGHT